VPVENRLVPLILDMVRQRRQQCQGQLALRLWSQLLLKRSEHILEIFRGMRHLQELNGVRVANLSVPGQLDGLLHHALVADRRSHPAVLRFPSAAAVVQSPLM
jgi:hypothetical protein